MLKNTFTLTFLLILSISFIACDMSKDMIIDTMTETEVTEPMTETVDPEPTMTETETETETTEPMTETENFVGIFEPENLNEPPAIEKQTLTIARVQTRMSDDPKWQGITGLTMTAYAKVLRTVDRTYYADDDGTDDGYTFTNNLVIRIPPPNTAQFEGYRYLPFFDANGEFTFKIGDEIEVIQIEIDKDEFSLLRNITRPEVDYSIFWE